MANSRILLLFLSLFFSIPSFLFAQEDPDLAEIAKQEEKFFIAHTKISLNNVFLDGTNYIETKISPFFKIENFYIGLDFPLKIATGSGGILNTWTYLSPYNYLQFINTLGYFSDIFDFKIGSITDLSWGEGLLMSHFRNDLFLPNIRQLGMLLDLRWTPYIGIEFMSADIQNFGLGGVSLYSSPLSFLKPSNPLSKMKISLNFLYDMDTKHILYRRPDIIGWGINPLSHKRYAYSVGVHLPLWQTPAQDLSLGISLEHSGIISSKQYAGLGKFFIYYKNYQFEGGLAYLGNGFHLNFFSSLYSQPAIRDTRPESTRGNSLGYILENRLSFFNSFLTFHFDVYGQTTPLLSLHTALELKPYLLGQLSLLFAFIVEDGTSFGDLFSFSNSRANTFLLGKVSYRFGDYAELGFFYRRALHIKEENTELYSSSEISVQVGVVF